MGNSLVFCWRPIATLQLHILDTEFLLPKRGGKLQILFGPSYGWSVEAPSGTGTQEEDGMDP